MSAGQASIQQQGSITNIHQSSQNAAINWQQFNIQSHETVNFHQPNREAITLNRVLGNERSLIEGAMNANGNVFISNPNGVLIGNGASINVGGLVATTHKISDADLMQGKLQFSGSSNGKVENLGNIKVPKGGVVALVAPIVKNSGQITASEGAVLLASAEAFRLSLPNDNFSYTLTRGTLQGLVDNGGAILADGGRVVLTAKGVSEVKKSVVKHSGTIQANTVRKTNGVVELLGDLDNSELHFSGSITAEAPNGGDGGFVETSAAKVKIADSAKVSTQAKSGKTGNWVIDPKDFTVAASGGDITGRQVSNNLRSTNVELKSRDGAKEGKGDVIVNDEISWNANTLTLNAENDIHINKTLNGSGTAKLALKYGQGTSDGGESDYYLQKDIHVKDRTVKVNLPEGNENFSLKKGFGSDGKAYSFYVTHNIRSNRQGPHAIPIALGRDIDLESIDNFIAGDVPKYFEGLGHSISNLRTSANSGLFNLVQQSTISNLRLINSNITVARSNVSLGTGIMGTRAHNTIIRDSYVSGNIVRNFLDNNTGGFLGEAYDSYIIRSHSDVNILAHNSVGGLVGRANNTNVYNVSFSGNITANRDIGGIIGYGTKSKIINSHSDINILGSGKLTTGNFGGIAGGITDGGIYRSSSKGKIGSAQNAGGLVGSLQNGIIENSFSLADVISRKDAVGGLAGITYTSSILNSYATGNVQGRNFLGGLVGQYQDSTIQNSYSLSKVSGNDEVRYVGGLVGLVYGNSEIQNSFALNNIVGTDSGKLKIVNSGIRTKNELAQRSTFQNWDFDNIWTMDTNTAGETVSYPKLRAFIVGEVAINPTETSDEEPNTTANFKANNLSKTYDGKALKTPEDLEKLEGWNNTGFTVSGLKAGDTFENSFTGKFKADTTKGTWKNAVNAGDYNWFGMGLNSTKYKITYGEGKLKINPKPIIVKALNNIRPVSSQDPAKSYIGVVANGLVGNDNINNVDINIFSSIPSPIPSYGNNEVIGGERIIRPSNAKFNVGDARNYNIQYVDGRLLLVQDSYKIKTFEKYIEKLRNDQALRENYLKIAAEHHYDALLAKAVYGSDAKVKTKDEHFYEIYKVEDSITNRIYDELKPLNYVSPNPHLKYTKLYGIVRDNKGAPILINNPNGKYEDNQANGLATALYRCVNPEHCAGRKEYYIVYRGTDTGQPINPLDSDGGANVRQGKGELPKQYILSRQFANNLFDQNSGNIRFDNTKIIGHSLGGGLATYASIGVGRIPDNNKVETILFNPAALNSNNIPVSLINYKDYNTYLREHYKNINVFSYDYDIVRVTSELPKNHYLGSYYSIDLLTNSRFGFYSGDDHGMDHILMTNKLINLVSENIDLESDPNNKLVHKNSWFPSGSSATETYLPPKPIIETPKSPGLPIVDTTISNNSTSAPVKKEEKVNLSPQRPNKIKVEVQTDNNLGEVRNVTTEETMEKIVNYAPEELINLEGNAQESLSDLQSQLVKLGANKALSESINLGINKFLSVLDHQGTVVLLKKFGLDDKAIKAMRGGVKPHLLKKLKELPKNKSSVSGSFIKSMVTDLIKDMVKTNILEPSLGKNEWVNLLTDVVIDSIEAGIESKGNIVAFQILVANKLGNILVKQSIKAVIASMDFKDSSMGYLHSDMENIADAALNKARMGDNTSEDNHYRNLYNSNLNGHSYISKFFNIPQDDLKYARIMLSDVIYQRNIGNREVAKNLLLQFKNSLGDRGLWGNLMYAGNGIPYVSAGVNIGRSGVVDGTMIQIGELVNRLPWIGKKIIDDGTLEAFKEDRRNVAMQRTTNIGDIISYSELAIKALGLEELLD